MFVMKGRISAPYQPICKRCGLTYRKRVTRLFGFIAIKRNEFVDKSLVYRISDKSRSILIANGREIFVIASHIEYYAI